MVAGWSLALNEYCVIDLLIEIFAAQQPIADLSHLIVKGSRSHAVMHKYRLGNLCTSDRFIAEATNCTTHNKHNRRTLMPSAGFEHAIPTMRRRKTYTLDRAAPGIGLSVRRTLIQLIGVINCEKTSIWNEMVVAFEGPVYHSSEEDMNTTEETIGIAGTPPGIRNGYITKQNLEYYCRIIKVILRQTEF